MKAQQKFSRRKAHRKAMLRNLVTSIVLYEKVKTTRAKAKAAKPLVEKMILLGKRKDSAAVRKLYQFFLDKNAAKKIQEDLPERFGKRKSGFIRTARLGFRAGDAAEMVQIELILPKKIEKAKEEKKTTKTTKTRIKIKESPKKYRKAPTKSGFRSPNKKGEIGRKIGEKPKKKTAPVEEKKKGWLERVSDTRLGKRMTDATKKVWRKRTTQK